MKLIGISGISGSGKTYLAEYLQQKIGSNNLSIVSFDDYYKPYDSQTMDKLGKVNFDLPTAVDFRQMMGDLHSLKQGETLFKKRYTFNNSNAKPAIITINPNPIILIEGIFVFHFKELLEQLSYKVFVESDLNTTLQRRIQRDTKERGISLEQVMYQWKNHVLPAYHGFLLPHKPHVDLIVQNKSPEFDNGLKKLTEIILSLKTI